MPYTKKIFEHNSEENTSSFVNTPLDIILHIEAFLDLPGLINLGKVNRFFWDLNNTKQLNEKKFLVEKLGLDPLRISISRENIAKLWQFLQQYKDRPSILDYFACDLESLYEFLSLESPDKIDKYLESYQNVNPQDFAMLARLQRDTYLAISLDMQEILPKLLAFAKNYAKNNFEIFINIDDLFEIMPSNGSLRSFPALATENIEELFELFRSTADQNKTKACIEILELIAAKKNKDELLAFIEKFINLLIHSQNLSFEPSVLSAIIEKIFHILSGSIDPKAVQQNSLRKLLAGHSRKYIESHIFSKDILELIKCLHKHGIKINQTKQDTTHGHEDINIALEQAVESFCHSKELKEDDNIERIYKHYLTNRCLKNYNEYTSRFDRKELQDFNNSHKENGGNFAYKYFLIYFITLDQSLPKQLVKRLAPLALADIKHGEQIVHILRQYISQNLIELIDFYIKTHLTEPTQLDAFCKRIRHHFNLNHLQKMLDSNYGKKAADIFLYIFDKTDYTIFEAEFDNLVLKSNRSTDNIYAAIELAACLFNKNNRSKLSENGNWLSIKLQHFVENNFRAIMPDLLPISRVNYNMDGVMFLLKLPEDIIMENLDSKYIERISQFLGQPSLLNNNGKVFSLPVAMKILMLKELKIKWDNLYQNLHQTHTLTNH